MKVVGILDMGCKVRTIWMQHLVSCEDKCVQVPGIDHQTDAATPMTPIKVEAVDIAKYEVDDIPDSYVILCPCCDSNMPTNHICETNTDTACIRHPPQKSACHT